MNGLKLLGGGGGRHRPAHVVTGPERPTRQGRAERRLNRPGGGLRQAGQHQLHAGLKFPAGGRMSFMGRGIDVIVKGSQIKPDFGRKALSEAFDDQDADIMAGGTSSARIRNVANRPVVLEGAYRRTRGGGGEHRGRVAPHISLSASMSLLITNDFIPPMTVIGGIETLYRPMLCMKLRPAPSLSCWRGITCIVA